MSETVIADRKFAIVDEWVIDLPISDRALRLYVLLTRYADNHTHRAWPSRETLSKRLNCSKASVDRAVNELIDHGAVSKQQRHNNSLVFTVHITKPSVITGDEAVITGDETLSSPVSTGVITGDDLTITTELEPKNYISKVKCGEYELNDELAQKLAEKHPLLDIRAEVEAFNDHHRAKGSTFKDWDAAFRTWCRNASRWSKGSVSEVKPAAKVPGHRDWVEVEHNAGEHWACRGGEFGHPVGWRYEPK